MKDRLFEMDAAGRSEISRVLAGALNDEPDVVFAYLHGSLLGDRPFHDIDVGVYLNTPAMQHTQKVVGLSDRLSRHTGYPVDVRALNAAPLPFAFRALQGELLVSRDDERLADVLESIGRRYLDIAPILRRATRDAFAP